MSTVRGVSDLGVFPVLGQPDQAKAALASARKTFANDKTVLTALDADAKDLKLN